MNYSINDVSCHLSCQMFTLQGLLTLCYMYFMLIFCTFSLLHCCYYSNKTLLLHNKRNCMGREHDCI